VAAALHGSDGVEVRDVEGRARRHRLRPGQGQRLDGHRRRRGRQGFSGIPRLRLALLAASGIVAFVLLWLVPLLVARLSRARDALDVSEAFQSDLLPSVLPAGVRAHYVASERRMLLAATSSTRSRHRTARLRCASATSAATGPARPRSAPRCGRAGARWRRPAARSNRLDLLDRLVESSAPTTTSSRPWLALSSPLNGEQIALGAAGTRRRCWSIAQGVVAPLDDARARHSGSCGRVCPPAHVARDRARVARRLVAGAVHDGLIEARRNRQQPRLGPRRAARARRRRAASRPPGRSTRC